MPAFAFTPEHGYVLLSSTAMSFYLALTGGLYVGRSKIFGKEWMKRKEVQELKAIHDKEVGTTFSSSGYPDMGNGLYSKTLSYADWYKFSNMQRAHYNLIESYPSAITLQIIAGLYFPKTAAALSFVWIGARHAWATNYISGGPENRYSGLAGLHAVCLLAWFGMSIAGGLKMLDVVKF